MKEYKAFEYRKQRYVFLEGSNSFVRINSKLQTSFEFVHSLRKGLSQQEAEAILTRNGENVIKIEAVPINTMIFEKVAHPFYVFQAASVFIWNYEGYIAYAYLIALGSIFSIIWEIHLSKKNERALRDLVKEDDGEVTVLRNNGPGTVSVPTPINVQHLVVGDAVIVTAPAKVAADIVLVQGDCVVVDESSLTGESMLGVKTSLGYFDSKRSNEVFGADKCKENMLFCGSNIMEAKPSLHAVLFDNEDEIEKVVGVVVATGFNSSKGELFRGILHPKKLDFKFYRDAFKFIGVLGFIAVFASSNQLSNGLKDGYGTVWMIITSLDLITIAVPPALPLILTAGISKAVSRLKKSNIFCILPERMNYVGRVNTFCWDKTGTLTTSKVTWAGIERCRDAVLLGFKENLRRDGEGDFERAIATCHTLNCINGELAGNSVDREIFEASKFTFVQDESTVTWNGHIFPVIARVVKPLSHVTQTPTSARFPEDYHDITNLETSTHLSVTLKPGFLTLSIPKPSLLSTIVASPVRATPLSPSPSHSSNLTAESLLILRRFEFDPKLQRTSVIYKPSQSSRSPFGVTNKQLPWEALTVVTKGSPETIRNVCKKSTIPADYHSVFMKYASTGWYVLALAMKVLDDIDAAPHTEGLKTATASSDVSNRHKSHSTNCQPPVLKKSISLRKMMSTDSKMGGSFRASVATSSSLNISPKSIAENSFSDRIVIKNAQDLAAVTRDQVERDMKFLGFVLLQNPLKSESKVTVSTLTDANIKSVIITGDNAMTAINVARQLDLCSQALIIDVFDGIVGFRRLKQDFLAPEDVTNEQHDENTCQNILHHASSIDSLASLRLAKPRSKRVYMRLNATENNPCDSSDSVGLSLAQSQKSHISESVPKIRFRSATFNSDSSEPDMKKPVAESFKVYPLDEIGRAQAQMDPGTEVAVTGAALEMLIATREGWMTKENLVGEKFLDWLVLKGVVFARMKPDQKTWIIERMMKLGKFVGMCGDGANDSGALKAAHVGLALSDSEASIVAPFTSAGKRVADALKLLREGRCSLDVSFTFMFMYPVIQLATVSTLNQFGSGLSNNQYFFDDFFVVLGLAICMLRSSSARSLSPRRPTDDLFSAPVIYSILGQITICATFFSINLYSLTSEDDWYCSIRQARSGLNSSWMPLNPDAPYSVSYPCYTINPETDTISNLLIKSQENSVVWLFAHFQYAILSLAFIFASPHRRPMHTNLLYIIMFLAVTGVMSLMQLSWEEWRGFDFMQNVFSIREGVQWGQRITALYLAVTNLIFSLIWETIFINRFMRSWVESREGFDDKKLVLRIAKQAGILSANETELDTMNAKRNILENFGAITGIFRSNKKETNTAWEGYVQSVVSATANKYLDTRLNMTAELREAKAWDRKGSVSHIQSKEELEKSDICGNRFEFENGKDDGFEKGFDAWKDGRRQTLQ
ncbi:hypothetical protein HK100_000103 [Physocladia obscura]|uniref:Cation-transporting ATPase n=1 Tax=Physocladia obscura TaxID=109957 RepID=A0AAD5SYW8_9FUNG|nr:hypothetical protein HK100_000103 [Physocladia obscura]